MLLQSQQKRLALHAAAVAGQPPACAEDAVAGDDDGNRVAPVGEAHRPRRAGAAEASGEVAVGAGCAVGDGAEGVPDSRLERGSDGGEGQSEVGQRTREVGGELSAGFRERRGMVVAYPV